MDFLDLPKPSIFYFLIILQSTYKINNCALETVLALADQTLGQGPQLQAISRHHADPVLNHIPTTTEH